MEEQEKKCPGEEPSPEENKEDKSAWQTAKESWYDKIPLTLKQLDAIVIVCFVLLGLCFAAICLDVMDIYHLFG